MVAPTLVAHGTDHQQQRYLRPLFTGEEIWCQLFSEPGAGSDVASLATAGRSATATSGSLNGQKVWTTLAHLASFGLLIARTDPDQPKHRGITAFLVDMHAPGVEVRPLYQMTGEAEFNEIFFTDARIPDARAPGGRGRGLGGGADDAHERAGIHRRQRRPPGPGPIGDAVRLYGALGGRRLAPRPGPPGPADGQWVRNEATRLTNQRASDLGGRAPRAPRARWPSWPSPRRTS